MEDANKTKFYFAERDGCFICGQYFTEADVAEGIKWLTRDDPVHAECMRDHEAGYDDWRGALTL